MVKGLIWGSVGFAAAFGAQRLAGPLFKDLRRYDRVRAMSGDGPFIFELVGKLPELIAALPGLTANATAQGTELVTSLPTDALRYARIKSM